MTPTHAIIRTDVPFTGQAQSFVLPDGSVAWTDHASFDDYRAANGPHFRMVPMDAFLVMVTRAYDAMVTDPRPITEEQWWDALEVLPPSKWAQTSGVEMFHVSERITGELVNWYGRIKDRYVTFIDYSTRDRDELTSKVAQALS